MSHRMKMKGRWVPPPESLPVTSDTSSSGPIAYQSFASDDSAGPSSRKPLTISTPLPYDPTSGSDMDDIEQDAGDTEEDMEEEMERGIENEEEEHNIDQDVKGVEENSMKEEDMEDDSMEDVEDNSMEEDVEGDSMEEDDTEQDSEEESKGGDLATMVQSTMEVYQFCMSTVMTEVRQSLLEALCAMEQSDKAMAHLSQTAKLSSASFFQISKTAQESLHEIMVKHLSVPTSPPSPDPLDHHKVSIHGNDVPESSISSLSSAGSSKRPREAEDDSDSNEKGRTFINHSVSSPVSYLHGSKRRRLSEEAQRYKELMQLIFEANDLPDCLLRRERERMQGILQRLAESPAELLPPTSLASLGFEPAALDTDIDTDSTASTASMDICTTTAVVPDKMPGLFRRFICYPLAEFRWSDGLVSLLGIHANRQPAAGHNI